ncbi:DUF998 domain-containing protein [Amycolatopsis echigonensis]|uniref:DUF998 domain-containing protein n=1 Tax=Amycolatopsis echigonensis TaxID=2576905 RepID=A0A2N3WB19_9PSEU|nr:MULTISPECIES: DUF998 domain-containing protein [Amycolatopsis]MBB2500644.1 DUF998 domain-containing protein [Amycolatopsis echigonensis]PKV91057.1 uncharacterized protein DUF998 [Amycolatopsis niigatensis]
MATELTPAPVPVLAPAPSAKGTKRALGAAVVAVLVATAFLVVLHVDRYWGPIDPVSAMLSDYAWTPGWWMWAAAMLLTSAGSVVVAVVLRRREVLYGALTVVAMAAWCTGLATVALFTKDPQGNAVTLIGKVHLGATGISCVSLPLAGWLLGWAHRNTPRWRGYARWSRILAVAAVPFFLPFLIPFAANVAFGQHLPTVATGLVERLMAVLELVELLVLAGWAWRAAE